MFESLDSDSQALNSRKKGDAYLTRAPAVVYRATKFTVIEKDNQYNHVLGANPSYCLICVSMAGSTLMPLIKHARELVVSSSSGSLDALQSKLQGVVHSLTVSSRCSRRFHKQRALMALL